MSFLGDLVNSIGTNKAPVLPKPVQRPPITSSAAHWSPAPRPKPNPSSVPPPVTGLKRKLDERDTKVSRPPERSVRPNPVPPLTGKITQKTISQPANGVKQPLSKPNVAASAGPPAKPPSKGSYAEMMAKAKEAQQTRPVNPVGTIKHQAAAKEKVSKFAERRRLEQERLKSEKEKKNQKQDKSGPASKLDRKRGASPSKKQEHVKIPRAPRPPLHAPATAYKGTMGSASNKARTDRVPKRSRYDEYLATDEEEDSEIEGEDDGYGYSDESSDMEAGIDDIDMEEQLALKAARDDDAREAALENELKREKEERKRKLMAMAKKNR